MFSVAYNTTLCANLFYLEKLCNSKAVWIVLQKMTILKLTLIDQTMSTLDFLLGFYTVLIEKQNRKKKYFYNKLVCM